MGAGGEKAFRLKEPGKKTRSNREGRGWEVNAAVGAAGDEREREGEGMPGAAGSVGGTRSSRPPGLSLDPGGEAPSRAGGAGPPRPLPAARLHRAEPCRAVRSRAGRSRRQPRGSQLGGAPQSLGPVQVGRGLQRGSGGREASGPRFGDVGSVLAALRARVAPRSGCGTVPAGHLRPRNGGGRKTVWFFFFLSFESPSTLQAVPCRGMLSRSGSVVRCGDGKLWPR